MVQKQNTVNGDIMSSIRDLIRQSGMDPDSYEGNLIAQQIENSLKLIRDKHDVGQLKLITRSLKEMRYAYKVFNTYSGRRRVSIFGSARTPEHHKDYLAAKAFSLGMASDGWMCITGAADGIMRAGLEGLNPDSSFGLAIRLPFETTANAVIEGDPKHITFRYFFTRKLMFMSHSDAVAVFPGGYGTLDELFEALTLMQTGKANIIPAVLMEGAGGEYWTHWKHYVEKHLLANGWISAEDENLFYLAKSPEDGVEHILKFYSRYDSSRYVGDLLVLRIKSPLTEKQLAQLNDEFAELVAFGKIEQGESLPEETDRLELPRLRFVHSKRHFGRVRQMIDRINSF